MLDYLEALAELSNALGAGADDPVALESAALAALLAGTGASGAVLRTPRGERRLGETPDAAAAPGPGGGVRRLALEVRGTRLGEVELHFGDGGGPATDEETRYLALAARTISAALLQAQLVAELRFFAAGLEEQVRERTSQAVRAERMVALGTLAQGVVAELERPLAAVHANLQAIVEDLDREILRAAGPGPLPRKLADRIRDVIGDSFLQVDGIARLAQDLRRLVPSEAAGRVRVDVNLLVQSALNLTRHRFPRTVEVRTDYAALPEISCYPDRLVQAFANLLANAADAVRGAGEIFVRTGRAGARVRVELRDTGIGIPGEELPRIFEPFYTTKRGPEAAGLGLSIVREVVNEHGGEVLVASTVGEGTQFEILLPI